MSEEHPHMPPIRMAPYWEINLNTIGQFVGLVIIGLTAAGASCGDIQETAAPPPTSSRNAASARTNPSSRAASAG